MSESWIDPGSLEGDALTRWYLRSPADVEREHQEAASRRYQDFFYGAAGDDPDPQFGRGVSASSQDIDPGFAMPAPSRDIDPGFAIPAPSDDIDPGLTWVADGPNRFRSIRIATDAQPTDPSSPRSTSYDDPSSIGQNDPTGQYPDGGAANLTTSELDLTPQSVVQPVGELRGPPAIAFVPTPSTAARSAPRIPSYGRAPATSPGQPAAAAPPQSSAGQTIAYGALRAPAPSDQELAELRRQQAAFADTTRNIDLQNSWFAVPALAPALVAMGLGAAGEWATGEIAPEAEQAVANFVEREPYIRGGDTWATRAGRRAHAALRDFVRQKPGWDSEPTIRLPNGQVVRPDVRTPLRLRGAKPDPEPFLMDLKPNTPSGLRAAARAIKKYEELTGLKARAFFYDQKPFI